MAKIGAYRAAVKAAEPDESEQDYFTIGGDGTDENPGVNIRLARDLSGLPFLQLAAVASEEADSAEGVGAMYRFLESVVEPDDWNTFQVTVRKERLSVDQILEICQDVIPSVGGRPFS